MKERMVAKGRGGEGWERLKAITIHQVSDAKGLQFRHPIQNQSFTVQGLRGRSTLFH